MFFLIICCNKHGIMSRINIEIIKSRQPCCQWIITSYVLYRNISDNNNTVLSKLNFVKRMADWKKREIIPIIKSEIYLEDRDVRV